ncbi:MAG: hypothetical protein ACPHN2_01405 [Sinimarinibacterium flocculans]|uniref:hypothetical protein n=1 Tax=Sinimarinibacterium flocculans TaxID=985250 RepID=UPI003C5420BF
MNVSKYFNDFVSGLSAVVPIGALGALCVANPWKIEPTWASALTWGGWSLLGFSYLFVALLWVDQQHRLKQLVSNELLRFLAGTISTLLAAGLLLLSVLVAISEAGS